MAEASGTAADQERTFATVARLVTAADGDTLYRDVYLRRAAEILSPIITETSYASALAGQAQLDRLLAKARAAVTRQDWQQAKELGAQAASLQRARETKSVAAAETVYGAPAVVLDPLSPGVRSKRWSNAGQARTDVTAALAELAREDAATRELYAARQSALAALVLPGAPAAEGGKTARTDQVSAANVEQQALQALEHGDAAMLESLATAMLGRRASAQPTAGESTPSVSAGIAVPATLGESVPQAALSRAKALGLEAVEAKFTSPTVARAAAEFVERYALGASPAVYDRAKDGVARVASVAAKELSVPSDVATVFADMISLLALHLYVNSAGLRYVPLPVEREALLVETHADGDETVTPLLRELKLDHRRGLSRDDIEDRLLKHGARVVKEQLGLDPLAFRIVCVPADVFVRLGRDRGWGQRPEWTHFDGYQVMKGGHLRALVGGNVKFGGLFDLCSISRDDGRDNTFARFAVIRRERLGVRIA